ncbi:hypothetical protein T484DRAFT_1750004 [Baffinella frigidus]|nr:hypothetical protein T484DRAFT_1750004 [Cryptophyta sp. CCMP2293]
MAPCLPTNNASTRQPWHLHVIIGGVHKSDTRNHSRASRLLSRGFSDEWSPATETDQDSVLHRVPSAECLDDICKLSDDDWDLDDTCWSEHDGCASADESADETAPANAIEYPLEDAASLFENVWTEADGCECTDENAELLQLLEINNAAPSDIEDAPFMWAAPQGESF